MANVTIETKVWNDARFKILANKLQMSKFDAIGRVAALWEYCTEHQKHWLTSAEINAISEHEKFAEILASVDVNLATQNGDEFYVNGTKNRIEWLKRLRLGNKNGGVVRSKTASRRVNGRFKAKRIRKPARDLDSTWLTPGPGEPAPSSASTLTITSASAAPAPPLGEGGQAAAMLREPYKNSFEPGKIKSVPTITEMTEEKFQARKAELLRQAREIKEVARSDGPL